MHFVDAFYTSDDGLKLYARDYRHPDPQAPVVLCLHGLTRNSKDFTQLAAHLARRYRVICPDQRGRGHSARDPKPEQYRPERYVQDMWRLLDSLGIRRVALVGTSLGGLMAMMMAAQDRERIAGAVLNDIGPEIDPAGLARIASYVGKLAPLHTWEQAVTRTAEINGCAFPDFTQADWLAMTANTYRIDDGVPSTDYDPAIAQGVANGSAAPVLWPLFERLAGVSLLSVRGELSDLFSRRTMLQMRERMPGLATVEVPRVGHAPTLDEPQARAAIDVFLGGLQ
ncbi:MAG: alpha/beta hydrolase [Pseudomonadota bacterium]